MVKVIKIPSLNPDDDSDSQMWRDWKAYWKERRASKLESNVQGILRTFPACFSSYTPYHYGAFLQENRLDYWPSSDKWQWKGRIYTGDLLGFIGFIKKRGGLRTY